MARRSGRGPTLLDLLEKAYPDSSRDDLYRTVMCGEVRVNGEVVTDPRRRCPTEATLSIEQRRFVSRAGAKLEAALDTWGIDAQGRVWLDAGASTGGFTDCLLQRGARAVHAVDVGYNQIDYSLRRDPRVLLRERTNINDLDTLDPPPNAAVCDLSFRSLRGVLRHILSLTTERWGIALLKPQFEVAARERWGGEDAPDPGSLVEGIVPKEAREAVIRDALEALGREGVVVERRLESPVSGRSGNVEELILARIAADSAAPTGV